MQPLQEDAPAIVVEARQHVRVHGLVRGARLVQLLERVVVLAGVGQRLRQIGADLQVVRPEIDPLAQPFDRRRVVSFQLVGQGQLANRQKVGRRQPQRLVELSDRLIEEGHGLLALALLEQRLRLLRQRDADAVVDAEMDPLELRPARDRLGLQLLGDRRARRLGAVAALQLGVAAGPRRPLAQEEHPLQILLQRLFVFRLLVVGVAGDERLLQGRHDAARPLHVHPDDQERRRDAGDRSFPSREEGVGPRRYVARARRERHQERAQATQ